MIGLSRSCLQRAMYNMILVTLMFFRDGYVRAWTRASPPKPENPLCRLAAPNIIIPSPNDCRLVDISQCCQNLWKEDFLRRHNEWVTSFNLDQLKRRKSSFRASTRPAVPRPPSVVAETFLAPMEADGAIVDPLTQKTRLGYTLDCSPWCSIALSP